MRGKKLKITLDTLLAITLVLLYDTGAVTGLSFHEWAGIVIGAVIVLHIALSWSWVVAVTKKFFGATTARARVLYVVDVLILAGMAWTIISGVFISKIAVPGLANGSSPIFKFTHAPISWLTLLLIGVHLGLHWRWVMDVVLRLLKRGKATLATAIALRVVAAAVFLAGVYAVVATDAIGQISRLADVQSAATQKQAGQPSGAKPGQSDGQRSGGASGGASGAPTAGPGKEHKGSPTDDNATWRILLLGSGVLAATAVPSHYLGIWLLSGRPRRRSPRVDASTESNPD